MTTFDQTYAVEDAKFREQQTARKYAAAAGYRYATDWARERRNLAGAAGVSEADIPDEEVERRVEQYTLARNYHIASTGRSTELSTDDPAVHALDVAAARAHIDAVEAQLEASLPAKTMERLPNGVDPQLRKHIEQMLRDGNDEALEQILVTRRTVLHPSGRGEVDIITVDRWHPDQNPRVTDPAELARRYGGAASQQTLLEFRNGTRVREMLRLRFGDPDADVEWMIRRPV